MPQPLDRTRDTGAYQRLASWHGELTAFRRDLHAHPEIGFEERRTGQRVVAALRAAGVDEIHEGIGKTGVVAVVHGSAKSSSRLIGLRADKRRERLRLALVQHGPDARLRP